MKEYLLVNQNIAETSSLTDTVCPSCRTWGLETFYEVRDVPVHGVVLLPTRDEALNYPIGDIKLGFCHSCGFISNVSFDPGKHEYPARYDGTQGFSPTFNAFHNRLVASLIERHDLHGKTIIEIGCGQGEFLSLLCEMGHNLGIGFDPAFDCKSLRSENKNANFIKDFYSEKFAIYQGDFICCNMTLEHTHNTADFLSMVRRTIRNRLDTIVFFQVPDTSRILKEGAFWEIFYEHCSYFSLGSLARLFQYCGFDVLDARRAYGDQYLMIEAKPCEKRKNGALELKNDIKELKCSVINFNEHCQKKINYWHYRIKQIKQKKRRPVLWGSYSKSAAFLSTLKIYDEIQYVVDINPNRQGSYIAGTGQKIVSPEFLSEFNPDSVIVMNPIYAKEIQNHLKIMNLKPELMILE